MQISVIYLKFKVVTTENDGLSPSDLEAFLDKIIQTSSVEIGFNSKNILNFPEGEDAQTDIRKCLKFFFRYNHLLKLFSIHLEDLPQLLQRRE